LGLCWLWLVWHLLVQQEILQAILSEDAYGCVCVRACIWLCMQTCGCVPQVGSPAACCSFKL
jgi:hypothetical protein